jgi:hypothetical protein
MKLTKDADRINRRCKKLEELGFVILHEDSRVNVPIGNGEYFEADFSAIDEDKFLQAALKKSFVLGVNKGEDNIQYRIKQVLGIRA